MSLLFRFQEMPDQTICDNTTGDFLSLPEFLKLLQEESMDPETNPEDLQDQIIQLEKELDDSESLLDKIAEERDSLKDDIADLQDDNKILTQQVDDFEAMQHSIEQLKATISSASNEVDSILQEQKTIIEGV